MNDHERFVRILVCRLCENSFAWPKRDLPDHCPACREPAHWRVADPEEITMFDRLEMQKKGQIALD